MNNSLDFGVGLRPGVGFSLGFNNVVAFCIKLLRRNCDVSSQSLLERGLGFQTIATVVLWSSGVIVWGMCLDLPNHRELHVPQFCGSTLLCFHPPLVTWRTPWWIVWSDLSRSEKL